MKYYSLKKFGPITTGHRQWRDSGHCKYVHGYARYVEITFACNSLDDKQWVMNFGGLKDIKIWLNEQWDHRLLIASDDPLMSDFKKLHDNGGCNLNVMDIEQGWGPGIEASCKYSLPLPSSVPIFKIAIFGLTIFLIFAKAWPIIENCNR